MTSNAHRSPLLYTLLALLADTILRVYPSVNSRSTPFVLTHTSGAMSGPEPIDETSEFFRNQFDRKIRIAPREVFSVLCLRKESGDP